MKTQEKILQEIRIHKVNDWKKLIGCILREIYSENTSDVTTSREDLEQEAWILLMHAAKKFDPDIAKKTHATFQTYAYQNIRWGLKRVITRAFSKHKLETTIEQEILANILSDKQRNVIKIEHDDLLNYMCSNLSVIEVKILTLRIVHNMSLREMSKHIDMSYETIRVKLPIIMRKLRMKANEITNCN